MEIAFFIKAWILHTVHDRVYDGVEWRESFQVFHTVIETLLSAYQSSRFQNVILKIRTYLASWFGKN